MWFGAQNLAAHKGGSHFRAPSPRLKRVPAPRTADKWQATGKSCIYGVICNEGALQRGAHRLPDSGSFILLWALIDGAAQMASCPQAGFEPVPRPILRAPRPGRRCAWVPAAALVTARQPPGRQPRYGKAAVTRCAALAPARPPEHPPAQMSWAHTPPPDGAESDPHSVR